MHRHAPYLHSPSSRPLRPGIFARPFLLLFSLSLLLAACASRGGAETAIALPADAVTTTRAGPKGEEIIEYRVAGQLRVIKVTPLRGKPYYLYDRNGDGRIDRDQNVSPVYFKLFEW